MMVFMIDFLFGIKFIIVAIANLLIELLVMPTRLIENLVDENFTCLRKDLEI